MNPSAPCQNPLWGSDCTTASATPTSGTSCYGVPLFRQDTILNEQPGAAQGIRLMGANEWQRNSLTANYGTYYIDSASGMMSQTKANSKNIFEANRTYYFFLVYAKPTTHQTYQLWIGKGSAYTPPLTKDWAQNNVFLVRVFPGG